MSIPLRITGFCIFLFSIFPNSILHAEEWKTYTNTYLGYSVKYPASLKLHRPVANKNLIVLYSSDNKFTLAIGGYFLPENYSLEEEWKENEQYSASILYKKKEADSFVTGGRGFYDKLCIRGKTWVSLDAYYPDAQENEKKYDFLAHKIASTFVFLLGDYDRNAIQFSGKNRIYLLATSPNGQYEISHVSIKPPDEKENQLILITDRRTGKILYQWESNWRSTQALWNENSTRVAINDRIANSGDYLYVFEVAGDTVKLLRKPEEDGKDTLLYRTFPHLKSDTGYRRDYIEALEWLTPHKLLVRVRAEHIPSYRTETKRIILKY